MVVSSSSLRWKARVFSMNTSGMYRGRATSGGVNEVAIYADE